MKNIANDDLVAEVKYRVNNLKIDSIISSGQLEQFIQDDSKTSAPQIISTERPDRASLYLLEGRVVVIVDGSPYVLVMPGILVDFMSSPEDLNLKYQYSNLLRIIRFIAIFFALLLPRTLCCNYKLSPRTYTNRIIICDCSFSPNCAISYYFRNSNNGNIIRAYSWGGA